MEVIQALKDLVESFAEGDRGLPEKVYGSTFYLLRGLISQSCADEFSRGIKATDGEFYWKSPETCQTFVRKWFKI
jgi:hypothetical protein